jgi:O-antigen/teichoic acid export membrane protein
VVGLYNAAKRLIESTSFIPENIAFALFPALSALYFGNRDRFNRTFQQSSEMMFILTIPITAGIFILAPQIIKLLFTNEFNEASIALRWLSLALGLFFFKYIFAAVLNSMGKQLVLSLLFGLAMILNVILNYLLIPEYQLLGASLATVMTEFIIVLMTFFMCRKLLGLPLFSVKYLKTAILGIFIILFIYYFRNWNIFIIIPSTAVLYMLMLLVSGVISQSDRRYYFNLIKEKINLVSK